MSGRFDRDAVHLRSAEGVERRACRMLLPAPARLGHVGDLMLATTTGAKPRVLAAMSLLSARDSSGAAVVIASARVVRGERRRGLGSLLLEAAIDEARRVRAAAVVVSCDPSEEPDGAPFLEAKGFARAETLTTFEVPTAEIVEHLVPFRDRLRERGGIPETARMVPLPQAPIAAAARLHAEHLAGTARGVAETLNDLLARDDSADHAVLMIGEEVVGLLVGSTVDGITLVEARVLSPDFRVSGGNSGWANVFMLAERLEWGLSRGSRITRFSCLSDNHSTLRLAARLRARPIREQAVFRLALER